MLAFQNADVSEKILEMWGHLRLSVEYRLCYHAGQHAKRYINWAQDRLCTHAFLVKDVFGQHDHELLTYQIHVRAIHVTEQVKKCVPAASATAMWVERMCGGFKKCTKSDAPNRSCCGQPITVLGSYRTALLAYDADMKPVRSQPSRARRGQP